MKSKLNATLFTVICLSLIIALSIQGCKNYDDGPFTLVPPKKRLVGEWELSNNPFTNQPGQTGQITSVEVEFEDDNDYTTTTTSTVMDSTITATATGEWEFEDDKETLELTPDNTGVGTSTTQEWEIEKLTKEELKVQTNSNLLVKFDKK